MKAQFLLASDTIIAPATAAGFSAIQVIRLSGPNTFRLIDQVFSGKPTAEAKGNTILYGFIKDGERVLDEVLISVFRNPNSYTKEDSAEISCHGSPFIVKEIVALFKRLGARLAEPGEFTRRAYLNGRFDLAQAEAVSDLIHAESELAHKAAIQQLRGGFSKELQVLRQGLIRLTALLELELDFSEEDVEFADRKELKAQLQSILSHTHKLLASFHQGRAIKEGIPVAIVGKPNAGKSTLLNALLNEDKALVSDIPGTTRDFIEDVLHLGGYTFRFIDTAGLRTTTDVVEAMGVARTMDKMNAAAIVLYLFDLGKETPETVQQHIEELQLQDENLLLVGNKAENADLSIWGEYLSLKNGIIISALTKAGLDNLEQTLLHKSGMIHGLADGITVTHLRHAEALERTQVALCSAMQGIDSQLSSDLLAPDLKLALHHLGTITGEVSVEDLLGYIFSSFCIGK